MVRSQAAATATTRKALDSNGNTLTKVVGSNTTSYAWDFENRLTSVTLPGSGGTVTFKYDPFGRRIYKSSSNGTSVFAYDGDNLVEETNSSGAAVARYEQTQNIDEPLAMLRSGATSYYERDGLGSVTSLSNAAGALAQTYTFDSFGKQTASSGSLTNPFQYASRELDSETMLYFMRARYFDPATGRFLSEDRIQFEGGINFFRYVRNNPANRIDPSGLNSAAGTIPWPRVLPFPIVSPWARAIAGGIGALLADLVWPDATNKEPKPCDRRKDDPCYIKYQEDAAWCAATFTGADDTLYDACMEIAWLNYLRCTNNQTPVDPDPRKHVPPKDPTPPRKPK